MKKELRFEVYHWFMPIMGERKIFKSINPRTGQKLVKTVFPPTKSKKFVLLLKIPQYCLKNLSFWSYNRTTREVEFYDQSCKVILYLYGPAHLINFSKSYLNKLYRNSIEANQEDKEQAMKFQNYVYFLVSSGIHSENHKALKPEWHPPD